MANDMNRQMPETAGFCDEHRLRAWVADHVGAVGDVELVGRAAGGSSNITLYVAAGDQQWVLRRPPLGDLLPTAHDVVREYQYVDAAFRAGLPVAEPIALCRDHDVIGSPFSLYRRVPGVVMSDPRSRVLADSAGVVTRSMISVLASLHEVDWSGLGLEAKPGDYLQRQVRRWTRQLELTPTTPRLGTALDEITSWIHDNVPEASEQAIVHGDYTLNNVIMNAETAEVAAVLDWEMATIGDPITDLVWLVRGWGSDRQPSNWVTCQPGALTADEAFTLYEAERGISIGDRTFYEVLCIWKGIAILEGLYAAWVDGTAPTSGAAEFAESVPETVADLHQRISCLR